jgi:hypothetical protein
MRRKCEGLIKRMKKEMAFSLGVPLFVFLLFQIHSPEVVQVPFRNAWRVYG